MIQLKNNKNKIILIGALVVIVFIFFFFWRLAINKKNNQPIIPPTVNSDGTLPARIMTSQEKAKVNIEASEQAEVVNDQNGFFVYKLKK